MVAVFEGLFGFPLGVLPWHVPVSPRITWWDEILMGGQVIGITGVIRQTYRSARRQDVFLPATLGLCFVSAALAGLWIPVITQTGWML